MHRFFVPPESISETGVSFTPAQARQMARVLRLRPGDKVEALDGRGSRYTVHLNEVDPSRASGDLLESGPAGGEPATRLCIWQGLLKGEKWEWVLQKGTEIGVSLFVPVACKRSVAKIAGEAQHGRTSRWTAILQEAAEQSGRGRIPELRAPVSWEQACRAAAGQGLVLYEGERSVRFKEALRSLGGGEVHLLLGPEGGLADEEVALARGLDIPTVSLGPRILRAETAAVAAAALALYELGDL